MIKDRQIKTGSSESQSVIILDVLKNIKLGGIDIKAGQTINASKSEAKRLLTLDPKAFKISMD